MQLELEGIRTKKVELENELQSLEGREKTLIEKISSLEERVALQELEEKVNAKREAVDHLERRVKELKAKLNP